MTQGERAKALRMDRARLQGEIDQRNKLIDSIDRELHAIERSCRHDWEKPERRVVHHEGYYIPADVGMGVDRRPAMDVPSRDDVYWTRTCRRCGRVERTERTRPAGEVPVF